MLRYQLVHETSPYFYINENSGCIYTSQKIDREALPPYWKNSIITPVQICDRPFDVRKEKCIRVNIKIKITDISDSTPKFPKTASRFKTQLVVHEDAAIGKVIGNLAKATDKDMNENVYYCVASDEGKATNSVSKKFEVRRNTLYLKKKVDYEVKRSYNLGIMASNEKDCEKVVKTGVNSEAILPVKVTVINVNDNSPKFRVNDKIRGAWYDVPQGRYLAYFDAFDKDDNASLTFDIESVIHYPEMVEIKNPPSKTKSFEPEQIIDSQDVSSQLPFVLKRDSKTRVQVRLNQSLTNFDSGRLVVTVRVQDPNKKHFDRATLTVPIVNKRHLVIVSYNPQMGAVAGFDMLKDENKSKNAAFEVNDGTGLQENAVKNGTKSVKGLSNRKIIKRAKALMEPDGIKLLVRSMTKEKNGNVLLFLYGVNNTNGRMLDSNLLSQDILDIENSTGDLRENGFKYEGTMMVERGNAGLLIVLMILCCLLLIFSTLILGGYFVYRSLRNGRTKHTAGAKI